MNILFVTQYDLANPDYGGPVFKVRYLSNYLANLGHNVSVVTKIRDSEYSMQNILLTFLVTDWPDLKMTNHMPFYSCEDLEEKEKEPLNRQLYV